MTPPTSKVRSIEMIWHCKKKNRPKNGENFVDVL